MTHRLRTWVIVGWSGLLLAPVVCPAQPFIRQVDAIPVQESGNQVALPFAGGVNSPTHQFVDIDGDGDYDLFILDTDLNIDFYRNEGTRFAPNFKLRNGVIPLPPFSRWFLFVDFDGDGRIDLCTEDSTYTGVKVYKNTGTTQSPVFTLLYSTLLDVSGTAVFAGQSSIPIFIDIDGDGDLDFFSPNYDGTVNFYENVGSASSPAYTFRTGFWQFIRIYGDTCTNSPATRPMHGAAAYRFADINGDGAPDMFIGDLFSTSLFYLCNNGTPQSPSMACCALAYPPPQPVRTQGFNQSSFVDIDGNGTLDLFVGVLGGIVQKDGFWFFRNNGTPTAPQFQLGTRNYLSMIDVGMYSHPAFVDIDADGDQDMFVGNLNGQVAFYRNTGTSTSPAFTLIDTAYQNIHGGYSFIPAFADIDGDGKSDLFIGKFDGHISYYHNVGTPQAAVFVAVPSPVDTIVVRSNAAAAFVDIDNDGDLDMFVGGPDGRLKFYRNDGTSSSFQPTLVSIWYQNITSGLDAIPTFVDIDGDGDYDLFIGTSEGRIEFYRNIGTPTNAQFVRVTNAFANTAPAQESSPSFVDIDGDGDQDLFMGEIKGGLHFYRNELVPNSVGEQELPAATFLAQNYPNPFNPSTTITYVLGERGHVTLKVFDLLGREVATLVDRVEELGYKSVRFDAGTLSSGMYFYRLQTGAFAQTRKLLVVR